MATTTSVAPAAPSTPAVAVRRQNGDAVRTRPQRRLTQAELDAFLEKAADLLRGGIDHSEFREYVFALLFYKRINDVYLENVAALEKDLGIPNWHEILTCMTSSSPM